MTTSEIMSSVRRKVLESTQDIIDDATLLLYINAANQDVYKRIYPNASIVTATVACTVGVCTLPSDFGTLYGEAYDASQNAFEEVSISDYARGQYDRAVTVENGTLKVSPITIASLVIKYWPKPATLTAIVNPTIDDFFHEPIVYGAVYRAHEDLQDETLTQFYRERFKQEMTERLEAQSTYEETNQRGGTMFTEQRLVSDNYASF